MRNNQQITPEAVLDAMARLDAPATIVQIAREVPCSRNTVVSRLAELGLQVRAEMSRERRSGRRALVYSVADPTERARRVDRAIDRLEAEAARVEERLTDAPVDDPRQVTIEQVLSGGAS